MRRLLVTAALAGGMVAASAGFAPSVTGSAVPASRKVPTTVVELQVDKPAEVRRAIRPGQVERQTARQRNSDRR